MNFKTKIKKPSFIVLAISMILISLIAFSRTNFRNLKTSTIHAEQIQAVIELR